MIPRYFVPLNCWRARLHLCSSTLVVGLSFLTIACSVNAGEPQTGKASNHAVETDASSRRGEPARIPANSKSLPLTSSSRKSEKSTDRDTLKEPNSSDAPNSGVETEHERAAHPRLKDNVQQDLELEDQQNSQESKPEGKGECPGAPNGLSIEQEPQADDIPLEQEEHPYDAPTAESIDDSQQLEPLVVYLSPREVKIRADISKCLQYFLDHPETVVRRGPWAMMHAALPFGVETEVIAGNRRVNAIGWMCYNGVCAKQRMFQPTRSGFRTNVGPGVQGHEGQFLAVLAQSQVQSDYPIRVGKRKYRIKDLVRYEMLTCREKSELTFKLIGLSYYLDQNQTWRDRRGHSWNLEKMVAEELAQPINGVACGGSHRLMGLSYAVIQRQKAGLPITGHWLRAEKYLNDYVDYAMSLQNPDGSFSTEWFESRGNDRDVERKVQTTGHIVEWLIYTLPDEHLRSSRIQSAIEFLLKTVGKRPQYDWPIGPRGHALRAMALYNERVFGAAPGRLKSYIADLGRESSLR